MTRRPDGWLIAARLCGIGGLLLMWLALPPIPAEALTAGAVIIAGAWWLRRGLHAQRITRHCLACGYSGPMETVLWSVRGGLICLFGLLCAVLPGIIYAFWRWNTPICPKCRAIGRAATD